MRMENFLGLGQADASRLDAIAEHREVAVKLADFRHDRVQHARIAAAARALPSSSVGPEALSGLRQDERVFQ